MVDRFQESLTMSAFLTNICKILYQLFAFKSVHAGYLFLSMISQNNDVFPRLDNVDESRFLNRWVPENQLQQNFIITISPVSFASSE